MAKKKATGYQPMPKPVDVQVPVGDVKLTNRDMIDFQKVTGVPLTKAFGGKAKPGDVVWAHICALGWLVLRKQQPTVTFDEVLDMDIDGEVMVALAGMAQVPTLPAVSAG